MDPIRKTAWIAGVLFVITFVVSIPAALVLYTPTAGDRLAFARRVGSRSGAAIRLGPPEPPSYEGRGIGQGRVDLDALGRSLRETIYGWKRRWLHPSSPGHRPMNRLRQ
jgi:hypothetical protein